MQLRLLKEFRKLSCLTEKAVFEAGMRALCIKSGSSEGKPARLLCLGADSILLLQKHAAQHVG